MAHPPDSPYIRMIQDCEAAIVRVRAAVRAGESSSPQVADDLTFVLRAVEPKLIGFARWASRLGPEAFEEALQALNDRLIDDIFSLSYVTMETQFGAYLNTRPLRVLQNIARKYGRTPVSFAMERLDQPTGPDGATPAELLADPAAESAFDTLDERQALQAAIAGLPDDERFVIGRRLAGDENNTIARLLGVSPPTATRIYQRALANLRRSLSLIDGGADD